MRLKNTDFWLAFENFYSTRLLKLEKIITQKKPYVKLKV